MIRQIFLAWKTRKYAGSLSLFQYILWRLYRAYVIPTAIEDEIGSIKRITKPLNLFAEKQSYSPGMVMSYKQAQEWIDQSAIAISTAIQEADTETDRLLRCRNNITKKGE